MILEDPPHLSYRIVRQPQFAAQGGVYKTNDYDTVGVYTVTMNAGARLLNTYVSRYSKYRSVYCILYHSKIPICIYIYIYNIVYFFISLRETIARKFETIWLDSLQSREVNLFTSGTTSPEILSSIVSNIRELSSLVYSMLYNYKYNYMCYIYSYHVYLSYYYHHYY